MHVVTVNDYLARRDAEWMGPIYQMLGLTVGCIQTGQTDPVRRAAYACDITYGTAKELGFDFLRDELKRLQLGGDAHRKTFEQVYLGQGGHVESQMPVQRTHHFAIVDEADSILIDEARTPLIIGANNQPTQEEAAAYYGADQLAATLVRVKDYKYDPLERKAELTAAGRRKVQAVAGQSGVRLADRRRPLRIRRAIAPGPDRLPQGPRLRRGRRRDRDRRRVHRPNDARPPVAGRLAPGDPGQGTAGDHPGNDHGRAGDGSGLLQALQEARRHDRNGVVRRRRAAPDLQGRRLQGPDQPPVPARLAARSRLLDRGREVPGGRQPDRRLEQARRAGAGRHAVDREVGAAQRACSRRRESSTRS